MITKEQAVDERNTEFHYGNCKQTIGPRGGVKTKITNVRRTGKTRTWVRQPDKFKVPIKYGMYESHYIDETNNAGFHLPSDCPIVN